MTNAGYAAGDGIPFFEGESLTRHRDIEAGLKLELKIAADGYPELSVTDAAELCRMLQGHKGKLRPVYEAAAAVYAHELYFCRILAKERFPSLPAGRCAELLRNSFGSVDNFFYLVRTLSAGTPDPGFLWLYCKYGRRKNTLGLARLPLYSLPELSRFKPLMCIDLWEHAYMDFFGQNTAAFADTYLRIVDWEGVFAEIP